MTDLLDAELDRLKKIANIGHELKVHWQLGHMCYNKEGKPLRGKVVGNVVLVFDKDLEDAKETLNHEFIEYVLDKLHEIENYYYHEREKIVIVLSKLSR